MQLSSVCRTNYSRSTVTLTSTLTQILRTLSDPGTTVECNQRMALQATHAKA